MKVFKKLMNGFVLFLVSLVTFFPLLWMFSNSFKNTDKIIREPLNLIPEFFDFRNFIGALKQAPFDLYIINSIFTALVIVILQILVGILLAYGLSRFEYKGKNYCLELYC